jgi:hypothetical protein
MARISATGVGNTKLENILTSVVGEARPRALGVAIAYVSVFGFQYISALARRHRIRQTKLVADGRDGITHPTALANALTDGWDVRLVTSLPGTFHPKLLVGAQSFNRQAELRGTSFVLAGSANLSRAALQKNGECSFFHLGQDVPAGTNEAWKECWNVGTPLNATRLAAYERYFVQRNKPRPPIDLVTLGVADTDVASHTRGLPTGTRPPTSTERAISTDAAHVTWAGLQSFTGDYNLQVEFPRDAGRVLSQVLPAADAQNGVPLLCEDGEIRRFIFRYYERNGMYRLNVPNATPNALWARQRRRGIAVVEAETTGGPVRFRIVRPGEQMHDIVERSVALGTWGRTTTRSYGWY